MITVDGPRGGVDVKTLDRFTTVLRRGGSGDESGLPRAYAQAAPPCTGRRHAVLALGAAASALPVAALAQLVASRRRVGFLSAEAPSDPPQRERLQRLQVALASLGYVEGRNIVYEIRWAEGRYEQLPALAAELVAARVDVIVTSGTKATVAAHRTTATVPIVMGSTGDPIGWGLTTNLAHPSANVTGWTNFSAELGPKQLELLKQASPRTLRTAYLVNPADRPPWLPAMRESAKALGLGLDVVEAGAPEQLESAFARIRTSCEAVIVQSDTLFGVKAGAIAQLAIAHRLASASSLAYYADAGGLITYGADQLEGYRRAATFVDKLLKGAKPADLAIQGPTLYERVVNLRTARALGLEIPRAMILWAQRVIE